MSSTYKSKSELQAENEKLLKELESLKSADGVSSDGAYKVPESDEIRLTKYIRVMSLCPNKMNLSTHSKRGRFVFNGFGEIAQIMYKDLVEVMELHPTFLTGGLFYILDQDVVRIHGLLDTYEKILNASSIERMISGELGEKAYELLSNATPKQQQVVVDLLISKLLNQDGDVDMKFVYEAERITGVDITGKVKEASQFAELHRVPKN